MGNKPAGNDRKRRIDDIKTQQKKSERRVTYVFVGVAIVLASALIAGAVLSTRGGGDAAISTLGVGRADAGCDEVKESTEEFSARHVGPGASSAELAAITSVTYSTIPPTGGDMFSDTAPPNRAFYDRDEVIAPERLVHNLEHGYVVVWYDKQTSDDDIAELRRLSRSVSDTGPRFGPKFIVVPYTRGDFAGEANIGLTAWGALQLCEGVSGEVVDAFLDDYRAPGGAKSKAPEGASG